MPAEVAARIKHWRRRSKLKGFELARECGVTPGMVSRWESGESEPTHENLARVARACGVDLSEFWDAPIVVVAQAVGG